MFGRLDIPLVVFWVCCGCVAYAYVGYPLLLALALRVKGRPARGGGDDAAAPLSRARSVSVVIAGRNECAAVARRVKEFGGLLRAAAVDGEIIVVSDGSTDGTGRNVEVPADVRFKLIELAGHRGKAAAVTAGAAAAGGDVIVFADCRQTWAPDALVRLLENFDDPRVGAVSGDLVVTHAGGVMEGVGLYWRYEKWLRRAESRLHSATGVSGSICAVRRELFRPIPDWTILDDVYWPLRVAMAGYRVVHDERAVAYDRLPEHARSEFRRKVRTLSGNFQLVARLPASLSPAHNPVWLQFVSHKLMRLLVPWCLIAMLAATALLLPRGMFFRAAFAAQLAGWAAGLAGLTAVGARSRLASTCSSFLVLNAAAMVGFYTWASGRAGDSWKSVKYADGGARALTSNK